MSLNNIKKWCAAAIMNLVIVRRSRSTSLLFQQLRSQIASVDCSGNTGMYVYTYNKSTTRCVLIGRLLMRNEAWIRRRRYGALQGRRPAGRPAIISSRSRACPTAMQQQITCHRDRERKRGETSGALVHDRLIQLGMNQLPWWACRLVAMPVASGSPPKRSEMHALARWSETLNMYGGGRKHDETLNTACADGSSFHYQGVFSCFEVPDIQDLAAVLVYVVQPLVEGRVSNWQIIDAVQVLLLVHAHNLPFLHCKAQSVSSCMHGRARES